MNGKILCIGIGLLLCACSSDEPSATTNENKEVESIKRENITLSRAESQIIANQTGFAFDLLNEAAKKEANALVAPQSLATMLAMMANGADGSTLAEIMGIFGLQPDQLDLLNNLNKTLAQKLPALDNNIEVTSANSFWTDPGFSVYDSFKSALQQYFSAELFNQSLATANGYNMFNTWCADKTNGMIAKFLNGPMQADFVIVNANYFNGNWSEKFDVSKTAKETFTNSNGEKEDVMMMHSGDLKLNYCQTDNLHAVRIPYGNSAYIFTAIMSKNSDNIPTVTTSDWNKLYDSRTLTSYNISLPRFSLSFKNKITDILTRIGLEETFGDNSDFSKMSATPNEHTVLHAVTIEVDEQGTKAAAVSADFPITGVGDSVTDHIDFTVNKPFVFVIEEISTKTIMYAGAVKSI